MKKECENCKFWRKQPGLMGNNIGTTLAGSCFRFPPAIPQDIGGMSNPVNTHILTWECDFCGEFVNKNKSVKTKRNGE